MFSGEGGLNKFLIVKTSSLGDIVQTYPVASYLKQRFPESQIDWIVEEPFVQLVQAHPHVSRAIGVDTKKWRRSPFSSQTKREFSLYKQKLTEYDLIIDLQGNLKSGILALPAKGKSRLGFGRKSVSEWPNLLFTNIRFDPPPGQNIRYDYLSIVQQFFDDKSHYSPPHIRLRSTFDPSPYLSQKKNLLVCPGAHWDNKRLSYETLLSYLKQQKETHILFIFGTEHEKLQVESLKKALSNASIIPKLSFPDLQNLMDSVDEVLAMDSFPLHLAGTTSTPTLSFFGPSLAEKYCPLGPHHRTIQGPCPYGVTFKKRCPKLRTCKTGACLKNLVL